MGWAEPTEATKAGLPADLLTWGQWEWCMGCMGSVKQFRIQDLTASPHLSIIFRKLGVLEVKERPPTVLFLGLGFLLGRQVSIETWSIFHCDKALRVLCWLDSVRLLASQTFQGHSGESRHFYMKLTSRWRWETWLRPEKNTGKSWQRSNKHRIS